MTASRKLCPRCLKLKPRKQFKLRTDGTRAAYCPLCSDAYFKSYNKKRYSGTKARAIELERCRVKYANRVRPARMERKKRLIMLMGGKCVQCGYRKSAAALDFDHATSSRPCRGRPNPAKARTISHLLARNSPEAFNLAVAEARKCKLVCSNCHRENTFPGHELGI